MTAPIDRTEFQQKTRHMIRYVSEWRGRHVKCCDLIKRSPASDDVFCQIFSVPSQHIVESVKNLNFSNPSDIA